MAITFDVLENAPAEIKRFAPMNATLFGLAELSGVTNSRYKLYRDISVAVKGISNKYWESEVSGETIGKTEGEYLLIFG